MHCPSCGFENPEGMKFCGQCASLLGRRCPQCGFDNPSGFAFCGQCATPLTEQPPAPQPQAPRSYTPSHLAEKILTSKIALEGERKQVTVLFADLKSSMELLANRDPEDARAILDPVLERMMAAVHRYEGTVNQVMGDGIMALFGAPIAHEDHAIRACYAALAMQASVQQYSSEVQRTKGVPIQIRVGLNAGEVVVRSIGSDLHMDYTAVGQTTHLAARMEQMAMPGSILITPEVLRLAEGYVQVTSLGPVAIKGLSAPLTVYEMTGPGPMRTRLQAAAVQGLTRFVGRDRELDHLHQSLHWAETGQGQVVALVGEPGVGKSRLVYECLHAPWTQGWLVLESRSVSYSQATAYLPVINLLKGYCQIEDRDEPRRMREKVEGKILGLDTALQPTLPAMLSLLDVPVEDAAWHALDPSQRRQRTLEAVKRLLLRESQVQPLLVIVEDLHWIDTETQAVLDSLVDSLPTARVLLLVNYRPEYSHGWGSKTSYSQLRLDALRSDSAEALLRALLGDDGSLAPLKQRLIEQTEGNPFFLEESARTVIETQGLVGKPGGYRLATSIQMLQIPATVQAVLAARIDRLPPEEKRLLQTAAVVGTEVPLPLLQAIAELPEATLHRGLAHLQAAEFLYETSLFPEPEYTFKHALTHEVSYGSLLLERRRVLHARLVEALEALAPDRGAEQVERLAHHALRGEVWDKAVPYCQQAGARAHERAAFREAVAAFEQALQALAHLPAHGHARGLAVDLRLAMDLPLLALGEHGRRLVLLGEAEVLARALDDRAWLGRVLAQMATVLRTMGDTHGAIAAGQRALALTAALGDSALQVQASYRLGQAYYVIGDFGRAAELLRRNVEVADRESGRPSTDVWIESQAWLARTLSALGAFAEGRRHGEEALRLATLKGRGNTPMAVHGCLGLLSLTQGDLEYAIRMLDQGLALCRVSDNQAWLRVIAAGLGYASALQGRLAEGRALLEEGISESIRTGGLQGQGYRFAWLSEVYRLAGYDEEAWQHARQALDLARQQKARGDEAHALHQLGTVQAHADPLDAEQAEASYRQALALAETLGMRPLLAHCHLGLGTLYAALGRGDTARPALAAAIALYRAMDMTFWLPEAEAVRAHVEGR